MADLDVESFLRAETVTRSQYIYLRLLLLIFCQFFFFFIQQSAGFCLALVELDLSGNRLPQRIDALPNTAAFLTAAPQLRRVVLARTGLPVATIVELVCGVRALRELDLGECAALVDDARDLVGLLRASHTLATLRVNGVHRVRSRGGRDWAMALATLIASPCPLTSLQVATNDEALDADCAAADGGGSSGIR